MNGTWLGNERIAARAQDFRASAEDTSDTRCTFVGIVAFDLALTAHVLRFPAEGVRNHPHHERPWAGRHARSASPAGLRELIEGDDGRTISDALTLLRALPALAGDPRAKGALDDIARLARPAGADSSPGGAGAARISALQTFQARILEAIANGVITLSPERTITTFNRAAEVTFGVSSEAMVDGPAQAIARIIPEFPEMLDTFFESGAVSLRAEVEAERADGTPLTLEMRLSPLRNGTGVGTAMIVTDVTEQRKLAEAHEAVLLKSGRIAESFSRYLAPHVVASLIDDPGSIKLGGERTRATMLFADVRGFTTIAAQLPAERVVDILNTYFEVAVGVVFEHDGLLDKFYGDGVMAVFGPPRVRPDDAARAVSAAIKLHERVARLGPRLDYPLAISIGLATGDVVAGHFGSAARMDYTVVGNAVNLASALQSAAPAGAIFLDEATVAAAGRLLRPVTKLTARIKGHSEPVVAYAILNRDPEPGERVRP